MSIERLTDIPKSELQAVLDDYELEGYEVIKKIDQGNGFWTVEVRKKPAAPPRGRSRKPDVGGRGTGTPSEANGATIGLTGAAVLAIAKRHVGQRYGHGRPDYSDPNWTGEFDCAEYASYCAYRAYGLLFGTRPRGSVNQAESFTGFWKEDTQEFNAGIAWKEALRIPGAFVLRFPPGTGQMGHIGIAVGDGDRIYEAHSTNLGVILGRADGRRWDTGVKLPGVSYDGDSAAPVEGLVFRLREPPTGHDPVVEKLQHALQQRGFITVHDINGIYDRRTNDAVALFQRQEGIVVDGEIGQETGRRLLGDAQWNAIKAQAGAVLGPPTANHDLLTLARTIYGEARGETMQGREAVGNVIMNRVRSPRYPNSIAKVCTQPFQFSCWTADDPNFPKIRSLNRGDNAIFDECHAAGERVVKGIVSDHTGGALHYHSIQIPPPRWVTGSPGAVVSAQIGTHRFYTGIA